MRRFKQLRREDRILIESMARRGNPVKDIAEEIGVHISTIYRELKRGAYEHLNSDWTREIRYSSDKAEIKYQENLRSKGPGLKIGKDIELANYIEQTMLEKQWSPEAILGHIKCTGKQFKTSFCVTTLYSYIDKGIFLTITNKNLPVKSKKKRKYQQVRVQKRSLYGKSIEKRPEKIELREEFGHWEMDTVVGKQETSKNVLLVLTERKTRMEIVRKLSDKTAESVCKCLNRIERRMGSPLFRKVFKTITMDNGPEFSNVDGIEASYRNKEKRVEAYYCHPYSSYERGTNEVTNKLVRRKVPKGTDFDDKTKQEIQEIEDWVNDYPREIFGFQTARERFLNELRLIG